MHRCRATLEPERGTPSRGVGLPSTLFCHLPYNVCHLSYNEAIAVRVREQAFGAAFGSRSLAVRDHFAAFAPAAAAKPSC